MINLEFYIKRILEAIPAGTVKNIYLTGSCAKNRSTNDSDIDFIVVADCFENISGYLREKIISVNLIDIYPRADIKCLTEMEFECYKYSEAYSNEFFKMIYERI